MAVTPITIGLTALPAVIMGHMALSRIKKSLGALGGKGMAVAGLIMGYLLFSIAILASLVLPTLNIIPEAGNRSKTLNNARQLVIAMRVYAADHDGKLPPTLDTLFDEGIVEDRSLLKVLGTDPAKGGWEYLGTGMKDSANGSAAVIISREVYRDGKRVVGLLDGSVCVEKRSLE